MIIKNTTREQIEQALSNANKKYNGNLEFNNFTPSGKQFRVTLRVKDSHSEGARLGSYQHHIHDHDYEWSWKHRRHLISLTALIVHLLGLPPSR